MYDFLDFSKFTGLTINGKNVLVFWVNPVMLGEGFGWSSNFHKRMNPD